MGEADRDDSVATSLGVEVVRSAQESSQLLARVAKLPPAPAVLRELFAIREHSGEAFVGDIDKAIEKYARRYQSLLTPLYHVVPWSEWIIEREDFLQVYERTRRLAGDFSRLRASDIAAVLKEYPAALMVFRLIAGYTWREISDIVHSATDASVSAQKLQGIERADTLSDIAGQDDANEDLLARIADVVHDIVSGRIMTLPEDLKPQDFRTRQHKLDTTDGWESVEGCAARGVGYAELLYERYTGRPFAYVRDALSEQKGGILEEALVTLFEDDGVPYERITDNAVEGWRQAPDFFLPSRKHPEVAIEAKIAADGGTARDKASRIERLARMCDQRDVLLIAVIDGAGFRRFNDVMLPIIRNTQGHTYTLQNLAGICDVGRVQQLRRTSD